jgi:hypothetical protein
MDSLFFCVKFNIAILKNISILKIENENRNSKMKIPSCDWRFRATLRASSTASFEVNRWLFFPRRPRPYICACHSPQRKRKQKSQIENEKTKRKTKNEIEYWNIKINIEILKLKTKSNICLCCCQLDFTN